MQHVEIIDLHCFVGTTQKWHHLALVFSRYNSNVRLFLNGKPVGTAPDFTCRNPQGSLPAAVIIVPNRMTRLGFGNRYTRGALDEFSLYDYVRSPDQILRSASPVQH